MKKCVIVPMHALHNSISNARKNTAMIIRYNDNSGNMPRLRLQQSLWAMGKLPMNAAEEWSLVEKMTRIKNAGFEAVECWLNTENEAVHGAALQQAGLHLVLGHRPYSVSDVRDTVERAVRMQADFIFAQPADAYTSLSDTVEICREGCSIANEQGLAFFVETHRSNYTENLFQTLRLIDAFPDIRFTADLSHFVLAGEFYGWDEEQALNKMLPVLQRTSHIHGRISNGEQIQVDVGSGEGDTAQFFVRLWSAAMQSWLSEAQPGDVFPFTSELGPPRYAITLPDGSEFSDRWQQSLVMQKLAAQAWQTASETSSLT